MTNANVSTLPITSLLPIANRKQQLVALSFHLPSVPPTDSLRLLSYLKESALFETLPRLFLILEVEDIAALPDNLTDIIPATKLMLNIVESAIINEHTQAKLAHFVQQGFGIIIGTISSQGMLIWPDTKSIAHELDGAIPFHVRAHVAAHPNAIHWSKKLATLQQVEQAKEAGFVLFSGNYAYSPVPSHKVSDGGARARLLKLLGLVSRDAESRELEELFKQDAALSFMLFKLVSTAAFARPVQVTSFGQAINLLGRRQLQRWLQLLLYARQQDTTGVLNPLMLRAAFRASLMEAICKKSDDNKDQLDSAFMVGMFSLLDILFGCSLAEILQPLTLAEDVNAALLHNKGDLGQKLSLVKLADRADAHISEAMLASIGLDVETYYACLTEAYAWVDQVCQEM